MKKLMRNDPCWCGSKKPYCECHMDFDKKIEMYRKKFHKVPPRSIIKNEEQLQGMRESSKINIAVLDYVAENIKVGMTTQEIDEMVYEKTTAMGGIPAPLNYEGFPKSVCTSINNEVCHGIPSSNIVLADGDIVNVDCSTILNGYFSDSSRMFCLGNVAPVGTQLVVCGALQTEEGNVTRNNIALQGSLGYLLRKASCHDQLILHLTEGKLFRGGIAAVEAHKYIMALVVKFILDLAIVKIVRHGIVDVQKCHGILAHAGSNELT